MDPIFKMQGKVCCFTGHRTIERRHLSRLPSRLSELLLKKYGEGFRVFRAGGALGFDTLAALSVLDLRRVYPDVRLELMLPCRDQAARWKPSDVSIYNSIIAQADSVFYAEEIYTSYCMHKRNRMLVNGADCCIAYYNGGDSGGTKYTYNYAQSRGVQTLNVWEDVDRRKLFFK